MSKVLIAGATGFLGSHLTRMLIENNYSVVVLKRSTSDIWRIENLLEKTSFYDVDLVNIDDVFAEEEIDIVINVVCSYGRNNESIEAIVDANLVFGLRLLDCCLKYGVGAYLNTDTMLDKSLNVYALSKKHLVEYLKLYSSRISIVNLKIEHMYGEFDDKNKFIQWFVGQLKENVPSIDLTEGTQLRDFVYIEDVVRAYAVLIEKLNEITGFREFELGSGKSVTVKDFLVELKRQFESKFGPAKTKLNFGAIPYRSNEIMEISVDISELSNYGWTPEFDIRDGVEKIIGAVR